MNLFTALDKEKQDEKNTRGITFNDETKEFRIDGIGFYLQAFDEGNFAHFVEYQSDEYLEFEKNKDERRRQGEIIPWHRSQYPKYEYKSNTLDGLSPYVYFGKDDRRETHPLFRGVEDLVLEIIMNEKKRR